MGDKRAVAYGQAAHLSVALRGGACDLSEFITLKAGVPRSGDFCGLIMIDDFVRCAQVPLSDDGSAAPSWQRTQAEGKMHALRQAYEDSGLPRHPDKAVWGLPDAEVWGSEILGKQGLVRPNFKRSIPLVGCVAEMLDLRRTSVRLLEVISGSFVSVFQFRRRLMSSEVYSAQAGRQPTDIISISPELHQELLIACLLVPTAFLDVRAPAAPLLVASDASTPAWTLAASPAAASCLPPLEGQLPADQELPAEHYKSHPLWQTICENLRFKHLVRAKSNRGSRHINILELKAALEAEAYVGKLHPFTRYVHLVDSQVAAASLVKGRSSSIGINKLLKGSLAVHLSSGVNPGLGTLLQALTLPTTRAGSFPSDNLTVGLLPGLPASFLATSLALTASFFGLLGLTAPPCACHRVAGASFCRPAAQAREALRPGPVVQKRSLNLCKVCAGSPASPSGDAVASSVDLRERVVSA